jgi:hypothetical protein
MTLNASQALKFASSGAAYPRSVRGNNQAMIVCCGSPLQRTKCFSIACFANAAAC